MRVNACLPENDVELAHAYEGVWQEWDGHADADLWEETVTDGIDSGPAPVVRPV
jgi:hypothetical protein